MKSDPKPSKADRPEVANRRERLRHWIATFPSRAEIERLYGVDSAHLWQLINKGSFGEKVANNICDKAGLPRGYFDTKTTSHLSEGQAELADAVRVHGGQVADAQAKLLAALIRSSAEQKP